MSKSVSKTVKSILSVRAIVITILAFALSYGAALLVVVYAYGKAYAIVKKPEHALWVVAKCLAAVCSRTHT